jgi:dihydrofolate synthase/folylpolyglutamate synthase
MSKIIQSHSVKRNLTEWLSYLESIHNIEIDLGLQRITKVAESLNVSFSNSQVITVAGTNGKGTTCAFLENALLAQNKTCAVYSSPHIERFNERLRINSVDIDDKSLVVAFEQIEDARGDITLTYYEYTTLAALLILMKKQPDVIVLEVGLGGRLDATNMVDADIAVVTTIDLDHQAFLGTTREAIGFEKAGIMRANVPAVIGDTNPPASLAMHANNIAAVTYIREQSFIVEDAGSGLWQWRYKENQFSDLIACHIPQDNVATAIMVLSLLADNLALCLTSDFINQIITQTKVPGRLEKFSLDCDVILDVGHNPQAARHLAKQLQKMHYSKIYAVIGMLSDKDIANTLAPLVPMIEEWYVGSLDVPRGCEAKKLVEESEHLDTAKMNCFDNVSQAFKMAKQNAKAADLVLVFGSFYTVAEIRRLLV